MPQTLLEKNLTKRRVATAPISTSKRNPTGGPAKGKSATLALGILGLLGISAAISLAPMFQPTAKVIAPQGVSSRSKLNLMAAYTEGEPVLTGGKSSQYQANTMLVGNISDLSNSIKPRPDRYIDPPTKQTNPGALGARTVPITPKAPQRQVNPKEPVMPQVTPPTILPNPFDGFMGAMNNSIVGGLNAVGNTLGTGGRMVGNIAGAGLNVANATMNVTGQVASNMGSNISLATNNMAKNIGSFQPMNNPGQAPTPQLDGNGPTPPNNGGDNGGNNGPNDPGSNGPNYGDNPSGPSAMNPGSNQDGPYSSMDGGEQGGGPCNQPPPPCSPCEQQETSFSKE